MLKSYLSLMLKSTDFSMILDNIKAIAPNKVAVYVVRAPELI